MGEKPGPASRYNLFRSSARIALTIGKIVTKTASRTHCWVRLVAFRPRYVPSCWPPRFAVAPVTDYSMLDAWRSPLHTDCSAFHFVRPVQTTDLTRRSTLSALRLPRIAPRSTQCARAGHGSLRATDCSVVQHLELCTACGLLRPRYLAFHAALGLLLARRFPLCAAHGLLRARRLALHAGLRIAPYSDTLRPCAAYGFLHARH